VNASAGEGHDWKRSRPETTEAVTRAHGSRDSFRRPSLSAEGRLRRAAGASRGIPFRDGRKRGEPQDRQRHETRSRGRGGVNRRGGAKPRGRHADGNRLSHPEGRARDRGDAMPSETGSRTLRLERWRGDLWTTPREETRLRGRVARTGKRRESRRQGQEGRAHRTEVLMRGPVEGPRGPRCGDAHSRSWRAAVNGQGAATSIGIFPPRETPHGVAAWRGPCAGAKAQHRATADRCFGGRSPFPWREERGEPKGRLAPEDQVNHIPVRPLLRSGAERRRTERATSPR